MPREMTAIDYLLGAPARPRLLASDGRSSDAAQLLENSATSAARASSRSRHSGRRAVSRTFIGLNSDRP